MKKNSRHSHIRFKTIITIAISNLRFKYFRSFLTVLGIVIGVGSIYILVSFGLGLQQLVNSEIIGNQSIDTIDVTPSSTEVASLSPDAIERISTLRYVTDVSPTYTFASQVKLDGAFVDLVAYGVDSLYLQLSNLNLDAGQLLNPDKSDELIINSSLLEAIGVDDPRSAIGKTINVTFSPAGVPPINKSMRVVGVADSGAGSEIFVSKTIFEQAPIANYTQAKIVVDDRQSIPAVRSSIESMGFETTSPVDTLDQINDVFKILNLLLVGLGSTGMVIAILGMVNTLTISLIERTKEIALMLTIGARPKDMYRLIMVEAVVLSVLGSSIGILIASCVQFVINAILNQLAFARGVTDGFNIFAASPLLIMGTVLLMAFVGMVVSIVPARRAARINPVRALHLE